MSTDLDKKGVRRRMRNKTWWGDRPVRAVRAAVQARRACRAMVRAVGVRARAGRARTREAGDAGMTTSEYALGTVAACGFAALLYKVVTSDAVQNALESIVGKALGVQV